MKLLVSAENPPGDPASYAYRLGVQFQNSPGSFDGGSCGHRLSADGRDEITLCDVECGGGGLEIAMSKDNKSAIVGLEVIGIWDRKNPDETESLLGGADDKEFFVDRIDARECAELLTSHEELASPQQE